VDKRRILIVDDEDAVRMTLQRWFISRGFDVDTASDGVEAVECCTRSEYDIVTMDLDMPRMGGMAAIEAIRMQHPALPIVVLTGLPKATVHPGTGGPTSVLVKPLRPSEVEHEIMRILQ
jgi:CheY-like chemotaxis protein